MAQAQESRSQLWKRYFEESQSQLQALDGALEALGQEPWELGHLTAAQGVFHNFAGSGTLYAAPQVSALGGEGEYMCASIAMKGQAVREEELQQIEGLARRIRAEFQRLLNASTSAAAAQSKTTSGVPLLFMVAPPSAEIAALTDYLTKRRIQVQVFSTLRKRRSGWISKCRTWPWSGFGSMTARVTISSATCARESPYCPSRCSSSGRAAIFSTRSKPSTAGRMDSSRTRPTRPR